MSVGDNLTISDGNCVDYHCKIEDISNDIVLSSIINKEISQVESDVKITLYQAIPKGDKLDFIVQKAVELGVATIVPFDTKRCVSRPDEKSKVKKTARLNKICLEAAKQCGRSKIPVVENFLSFDQAIDHAKQNSLNLFFYEYGGMRLNDALSSFQGLSIGIFIGSEGGFEPYEVDNMRAADINLHVCTLGKLILRCETAGITAVSIIKNILGDI